MKEIILNDDYWYYEPVYFPLHLTLYGELEKDTIHVMTSASGLYQEVGVRIIPFKIFPQLLYNEIIDNEGYINVNKDIFEWYKKHAMIKNNEKVDSIYAIKGISGLLEYAIDENGRLVKFGEESIYIMYLCFQHNILFYSSYYDPWIYIISKNINNIIDVQ
ncbi:MAG: hypothetical protein E7099_08025 [Mediterranea massiliensis]|nr:hypothetical protein [Mediterranea massiliensis]